MLLPQAATIAGVDDKGIEALLASVDLSEGADGGVELLHGTSAKAAASIVKDRVLIAGEREDRIYFASHPSIAADHEGVEVLVPVRVRVADLIEHRTWPPDSTTPDRIEFLVEGRSYPLMAVGRAEFTDARTNAGPDARYLLDD